MLLLFIQLLLILVNLVLITIVYKGQQSIQTRNRSLERLFIVFVASLSGWILAQTSYDYLIHARDVEILQVITNAALVLSVSLMISFWLFMSLFAGIVQKKSVLVGHLTIASLISVVGLWVQPVYITATGDFAVFEYKTALYFLYTLYLLGYFLGGLQYLLRKKYYLNGAKRLLANRRRLITGFLAALVLIIIGNVILPVLGVEGLGGVFKVFGATLLSVSAASSAFNLGVFNFRKFIFRSIINVGAFAVAGLINVIVFSFIATNTTIGTAVGSGGMVARVIFILYVFISAIAIFGLKLLIDKLFVRFYTSKEFNELTFEQRVEEISKKELSNSLTLRFAELCSEHLGVDRVAVIVYGAKGTDLSEYKAVGDTMSGSGKDARNHVMHLAEMTGVVSAKNEPDDGSLEDFTTDVDNMFHYVLRQQHSQMEGMLFFGSKVNGRKYYIDEINAVRKGFIDILLAMQSIFHIQRLIEFNEHLEERIEDATKQLRRSNAKLRALDEAKDEFISMASHQLRTPLTSIKGYISMVLEGDAGELKPMQRDLLKQSYMSSQRMVYLISDLLNVSRLKTGKFVIEAVPTNLTEVVQGELEQLKEMATSRQQTLVFDPPQEFPVLNLDETKVRQVIMNFVDNAIYYTPAGGKIEIKLGVKPESVEFTVTDNGLGVPKEDQPHLFTKFYRAQNAQKARPDGTGLGLYMAKKIITAQGGAIIFRSEQGKGSTFGFSFPKQGLQASSSQSVVSSGE